MNSTRTLLEHTRLSLTLDRLCFQLIETYDDFNNTCIVGIQARGVEVSNRLIHRLQQHQPAFRPEYGKLDITFYRDDFRTSPKPLTPSENDIPFLVENKRVVIVDDVLYTGRTIQAALSALSHYGRPQSIELLVLVDRRFNRELPIQADYYGMAVDSRNDEYVQVYWGEKEQENKILLLGNKQDRIQ